MGKSKYFILNENEKAVADVMGIMLNQKYFTMNYKEGKRYSFIRVDGIDKIYGKAKGIINKSKNN